MERFQRSSTNTDMPCIRDTARNRIVAIFFTDADDPDAATVHAAVCTHALNLRGAAPRQGSLLEESHADF